MKLKIRHIIEGDKLDLWKWRNHPNTRRWSFNVDEIEYKNHEKWFNESIKKENIKIYIAENKKNKKIGQIRFNIELKKAHININLNPEFFGKGLGNKVIRMTTEFFLNEKQDIEEVIAEVICGNVASKKAFEKAGYVQIGEKDKNLQKINLLVYKRNASNELKN